MPGARATVVNRVLLSRNEMPVFVPLLSHKGRTHWLWIAFTGVSAVAGATRDLPRALLLRGRCGVLAKRGPAREGLAGGRGGRRRGGVRLPIGKGKGRMGHARWRQSESGRLCGSLAGYWWRR